MGPLRIADWSSLAAVRSRGSTAARRSSSSRNVGPDTPIVRYEAGDKSELKPGAKIRITNAVKKPDGTFETARISVGRGDVTP